MKLIINHSELTLKGKNRPVFENQLADNIRHGIGDVAITNLHGRFIVTADNNKNTDRLSDISGVANYSIVQKTPPSPDALITSLFDELPKKEFSSFAIRMSRLDKTLPFTSGELTNKIGDEIRTKLAKKVNLDNPDMTIYIDCYHDFFLYYFEKIQGPHGLPVGTGGKVLALLSGGIDSPVAAYLAAKRGCTVDFLHFHAFADNERAKKSKITETAKILNKYTLYSTLYLLPYLPFQLALMKIKTENELILFRRFMVRIAEACAIQNKYQAIITGDNLGQVASQTIENLTVTEQAVDIPVFRPLLTYNKEEIIHVARKIGTYELAKQPYKDCCSIIEKHPKTKSRLSEILDDEAQLPMEDLIKETIQQCNNVAM